MKHAIEFAENPVQGSSDVNLNQTPIPTIPVSLSAKRKRSRYALACSRRLKSAGARLFKSWIRLSLAYPWILNEDIIVAVLIAILAIFANY